MMIFLVATLLSCTPQKFQQKPAKPRVSVETTFKRRWLALHFRELAK